MYRIHNKHEFGSSVTGSVSYERGHIAVTRNHTYVDIQTHTYIYMYACLFTNTYTNTHTLINIHMTHTPTYNIHYTKTQHTYITHTHREKVRLTQGRHDNGKGSPAAIGGDGGGQ